MRLTCPNCDAQYEVPDDVIPQDGRDVQCSNCGNTWFQAHPDHPISAAQADETEASETEWAPEVSDEEPLRETNTNISDEPEARADDGPVTMSSDAPDEVLAAAVKAAIRRARPDATTTAPEEDEAEEPLADRDRPETAHDSYDEDEMSFEDDLDARLTAMDEEEDAVSEAASQVSDDPEEEEEDAEDSIYFEPEPEDEEIITPPAEAAEPKRRTIDPSVANILQEEAALEAERRAGESGLESQPDLGLEDTQQEDAAKRARQARERMARMRGLPADSIDKPVEPIPANSRRDLLPDIEEINSTLRATEDRAPEEQPDGRPTASQRRAGGKRIGFAMALLLMALLAYIYNRPEVVSATIPGADNYVAAFVNAIDNGRIALDNQLTKLMLWLDSMSSE